MMLMCNTASIEVACHCLSLLVIDPFVLMRPPSLPPWTTYQTHGQAGQTIETNRPPFGQVHGAYPSKCQSQNLKRLHRLHSQPLYNSHKVQLGLIEGCSTLGITWTGSIILDPYCMPLRNNYIEILEYQIISECLRIRMNQVDWSMVSCGLMVWCGLDCRWLPKATARFGSRRGAVADQYVHRPSIYFEWFESLTDE